MRFLYIAMMLMSVVAALCISSLQPVVTAEEASEADAKFFRDDVFPILKESCHRCHGEKKQKSSLRLDSREAVLKGGANGPAIVPGKPEESLMMTVVEYAGDIQMPPDAKLDDEKIAILKKWIEKNAPWPTEKKKN